MIWSINQTYEPGIQQFVTFNKLNHIHKPKAVKNQQEFLDQMLRISKFVSMWESMKLSFEHALRAEAGILRRGP